MDNSPAFQRRVAGQQRNSVLKGRLNRGRGNGQVSLRDTVGETTPGALFLARHCARKPALSEAEGWGFSPHYPVFSRITSTSSSVSDGEAYGQRAAHAAGLTRNRQRRVRWGRRTSSTSAHRQPRRREYQQQTHGRSRPHWSLAY